MHLDSSFRQLLHPILKSRSNLRSNTVLLLVKVTAITTKLNEFRIFICIFLCENCCLCRHFYCNVYYWFMAPYHTQTKKCIKWLRLNGIVKSCGGMHAGRLQNKYNIKTQKNHLISIHTNNTSITNNSDGYANANEWVTSINFHCTAFFPRAPRKFYYFLIFSTNHLHGAHWIFSFLSLALRAVSS